MHRKLDAYEMTGAQKKKIDAYEMTSAQKIRCVRADDECTEKS